METPQSGEPLPARLRDVLAGLVRGEAEKQIARRLGLSPNTVNRHVQRLYRRFDVRSRGELMFQLAQKERARLETNLARVGRD
jgi:DNA-binding NarL/FixJ family response regulator